MRPQPAIDKGGFEFRLDLKSGVPVYRQIIDQLLGAIATGALRPGARLPTVRQLAVDLEINPNTVVRAYRELEIREVLTTQQGTGTFVTEQQIQPTDAERQRRVSQLVGELLSKAGAEGITLAEILERLQELNAEQDRRS
jgi:GntR family transcriptional regulator